MTHSTEHLLKRTRSAFIWTRILSIPFWGLVNMLSIILYKDLHITPFQITLILMLKPMSALLAPYWSQAIYQRQDRVISNLVWSNILRYIPFLFLPWVESPWVIILAFAVYMVLYRGSMPAWMETFKRNLPEVTRERIFAYGSTIEYCGTAALPLALGFILDGYEQAWRWLFPVTALLGLASTWFLYRLPAMSADAQTPPPRETFSLFKEHILKPWKQSWSLMCERADFASFQVGFMLGGAGLMVMQPALPMFFVDILDLSYTKIMFALAMCKGIGFTLASPFWIKMFRKVNIFSFSALVTVLAALFPFFLIGAQYHIVLLYVAYGLYGIMQAGSELSWHMSGPIFSQHKDSSAYSGTNVLSVGIRGCIAPTVGSLLYTATNSTVVMLLGSLFCFMATRHLATYSSTLKQAPETN